MSWFHWLIPLVDRSCLQCIKGFHFINKQFSSDSFLDWDGLLWICTNIIIILSLSPGYSIELTIGGSASLFILIVTKNIYDYGSTRTDKTLYKLKEPVAAVSA